MPKSNDKVSSQEFLIAEFNALQDRAIGFEEIKSGRINFFLIIVAATIAGLSSLPDTVQSIYQTIILAGALIVFLLGISTLKSVMDYSVAIVVLFRKAGRIRRWFLDNDKRIENYIPFEPNDDRPSIRISRSLIGWRGGEPILLITNATALSVAAGIAFSYLSLLWSIIGAIVTLLLTWFFQVLYMSSHLKKYETLENQKSLFPTLQPQAKKPSRKTAT